MRVHTPGELLYIYGFLEKGAPDATLDVKGRKHKLNSAKDKKAAGEKEAHENLISQVDFEELETANAYYSHTNYPESAGNIRFIFEDSDLSLEHPYFWILEHMRQDRGFFDIIKVTDMYTASQSSAFWGNQQQRISAQQNQAQGLLANIGKFIKELFQMVRELRIIDERLVAYEDWQKKDADGKWIRSDSADVTLKSIFTDVAEGGTKNPQSVFGLAQTVGFTILPDLFFNTRVYDKDKLDAIVDKMEYNTSVKNVLRRKLFQFLVWKDKTHTELLHRRRFNISYLKQHWGIIKMYMNWAKPYLKNLQKLQMREDLDESPDLVASFDQNMSEVEFIAKKPKQGGYYPVAIVNFSYRTRPSMNVRKEYQQGPTHMGRMDISFRAYAWDDDQIQRYIDMRAREELELLGLLDSSLAETMKALGDDFEKYLGEQEEVVKDDVQKPSKSQVVKNDLYDTLDPFISLFGGFAEIFSAFNPIPKSSRGKKRSSGKGDPTKAARTAINEIERTFHIYKKAHRLLTW